VLIKRWCNVFVGGQTKKKHASQIIKSHYLTYWKHGTTIDVFPW
jgi:hypothetical protein